jgi:hypothetical protein
MAPAIARSTGPGEKRRAGGGAAAVGGQALDRRPLACELRERGLNQVLSFASSPSPGISIGVSGASWDTPIRRSAPCMTCANTGAATAPP